MRFYIILFFCSVCFLFSCSSDNEPADLIQLHEMAQILTEMHIIDGSIANVSIQPDSLVKHGMGLYLGLFKVHHIDSAQFRRNMIYYAAHPDILYEIYIGVNNRLQHKLDSLKAIQAHLEAVKRKAPNFKADSIKAKNKADSLEKVRTKHVADSIKKAAENQIKNQKAEAKRLLQFQNRVNSIKRRSRHVDQLPNTNTKSN